MFKGVGPEGEGVVKWRPKKGLNVFKGWLNKEGDRSYRRTYPCKAV